MIEAIAWNLIPGPTTAQKWNAFRAFPTPEKGWAVGPEALGRLGSWPPAAVGKAKNAWPSLLDRARREARRLERDGLSGTWPGRKDFPPWLAEIPDPPVFLYVRGHLAADRPRLAIVGSRRASPYGKRVAEDLAELSVEAGFEVVSGGARGVDARAHRGALARGGSTVAVLAGGLDRPYPPDHAGLFEKIARNGALISESPLGSSPLGWTFLRRNRLISGLSRGVVVVEAAARSGAVSTAHHAAEQGREVLAVPGSIYSETSVGAHALIADGARILSQSSDLFDECDPPNAPESAPDRPAPAAADMTADESTLYKVLSLDVPRHLDEIADRVSFGVARLQVALYGLLDGGSVEELTGRYYILRPRR